MLKALAAKGADVDTVMQMRGDTTALTYAVTNKQTEAALYLLDEAGAAWDLPDPFCLLLAAARDGLLRFTKSLLRHMRSKGVNDEDINHLLACVAGEIIREGSPAHWLNGLAEQGLDVKRARVTHDAGMVPLFHLAYQHGNSDAVAYLQGLGCDAKEADDG